jgi:putative endonuclease
MRFVYVLKSLRNSSYYVGYASDLDRRLKQHNEGLVKSTKYERPFEIVYRESFSTATEARKREAFLKRKKSRKYLDLLTHGRVGA